MKENSKKDEFQLVMKKLKEIFEIKFDKELASLLNLSTVVFSDRAKRGSLPYEHILSLCLKNKIDLNILFFSGLLNFKNQNGETILKYEGGLAAYGNDSKKTNFIVDPSFINTYGYKAVNYDLTNMSPIINEKDIIVIDEEKRDIKDNCCFLIRWQGGLKVIRLFQTSSKGTSLGKNDNKKFPDILFDETLDIVGQVIVTYHQEKDLM